jgi:hypothetical protein
MECNFSLETQVGKSNVLSAENMVSLKFGRPQ